MPPATTGKVCLSQMRCQTWSSCYGDWLRVLGWWRHPPPYLSIAPLSALTYTVSSLHCAWNIIFSTCFISTWSTTGRELLFSFDSIHVSVIMRSISFGSPFHRLTPRNCPLLTDQNLLGSQPWFEMMVKTQEITRDLSGTHSGCAALIGSNFSS